jgi:hypothetical protein
MNREDDRPQGRYSLRRARRPMPPGRLAAMFALFVALLIYQRQYVMLALAGLGLILYGYLTRRK